MANSLVGISMVNPVGRGRIDARLIPEPMDKIGDFNNFVALL
jgi:hypothetical protein